MSEQRQPVIRKLIWQLRTTNLSPNCWFRFAEGQNPQIKSCAIKISYAYCWLSRSQFWHFAIRAFDFAGVPFYFIAYPSTTCIYLGTICLPYAQCEHITTVYRFREAPILAAQLVDGACEE